MKTLKAVDLFAGAGGFTTGATQAGIQVLYAANHWQAAVAAHAENHPRTVHACQDLRQANWNELPAHDLLLASPACQGHSRARGRGGRDQVHHDAARQTAWAVVDCVGVKRPRFLVVENVAEFQTWELFDLWKQALERYGYKLTLNLLNAADFGVPQSRERLFIVGSLDGEISIKNPELEHVSARSILNDAGATWSQIRKPGRAKATLERIERTRARRGDVFLMDYYGHSRYGRDLDKPLGTVTTKDRFALVHGDRMRMLTPLEYKRAMGFPDSYALTGTRKLAIHLLGNAVCPPVAAEVVRQIKAVA